MTRLALTLALTLALLAMLGGCVMTFKPEDLPQPDAQDVNAQVAVLLDHQEQYGNETRLAAAERP